MAGFRAKGQGVNEVERRRRTFVHCIWASLAVQLLIVALLGFETARPPSPSGPGSAATILVLALIPLYLTARFYWVWRKREFLIGSSEFGVAQDSITRAALVGTFLGVLPGLTLWVVRVALGRYRRAVWAASTGLSAPPASRLEPSGSFAIGQRAARQRSTYLRWLLAGLVLQIMGMTGGILVIALTRNDAALGEWLFSAVIPLFFTARMYDGLRPASSVVPPFPVTTLRQSVLAMFRPQRRGNPDLLQGTTAVALLATAFGGLSALALWPARSALARYGVATAQVGEAQ